MTVGGDLGGASLVEIPSDLGGVQAAEVLYFGLIGSISAAYSLFEVWLPHGFAADRSMEAIDGASRAGRN